MKKKSAFTLYEIVAVLAIIGILATIMFRQVSSSDIKGKESEVLADFREMGDRVVTYMEDTDETLSQKMVSEDGLISDNYSETNKICYGDITSSVGSHHDGFGSSKLALRKELEKVLRTYTNVEFSTGDIEDGGTRMVPVKTSIKDPWNNKYHIYGFVAKESTGVGYETNSKDLIIIYSGGRDSYVNGKGDYAVVVSKINGKVKMGYLGFENDSLPKVGIYSNDIYGNSGNVDTKESSVLGYIKFDNTIDGNYFAYKFDKLGVGE